MRMRLKHVATAAALLLLLTWLALRSTSTTAHNVQQTLDVLDQVAAAESDLHRDLLGARTGILNNYDPIVAEMKAISESVSRLRVMAPGGSGIATEVDRFRQIVDLQEQETERFKSRNALLRNSLAYFQLYSARLSATTIDPALVVRVSNLTAAMLHLTLDSAPSVIGDVDRTIDDIPLERFPDAEAEAAKALLSHANLLRDLLPETDRELKTLFALPSDAQRDRIRALVVARSAAHERTASRYRIALYAVSLVLAGALIVLGLRLERRARGMRRRAGIEHVIAGISTRFINARSESVPVHAEHALKELSQCLGADRAYFIAGGEAMRAYLWRGPGVGPPPDWPLGSFAAAAAARNEPRGMIHRRCSDSGRAEAVSGTRDCACIAASGDDAVQGLLGFEALGGNLRFSSEDCGLWRMAFDSFAHAVERELLEEERRGLEAKLQQARRLETIGTLASGIAHNFNNIVGAILGYAEMAQAHVRSGTRPAESLMEIRRAGNRARDLIDQILSFGRLSDSGRQPVRLDTLIAEARSLLGATLPSRVRFEIRQTDEAVTIRGVPAQLQQVLVNIGNNAIQAVDGEGAIALETRIAECDAVASSRLGRLEPRRHAVISISDNGRGMDETTRKHVFEPFFTTRAEGNGLGLATALEIVRGHGGDIVVESAIGTGTRFEIWLPCDRACAAAPTEPSDAAARGSGDTVLLYEADRDELMKQEEILAALGYEPAGYSRFGDLADACRAAPGSFDIALLCCQHADTALLLSASLLHRAAPTLPIILAVTSSVGLATQDLAAAGVTEIIRLPLASGELADALARCSRRSTGQAGGAEDKRRGVEPRYVWSGASRSASVKR